MMMMMIQCCITKPMDKDVVVIVVCSGFFNWRSAGDAGRHR